MYRMITFDMDGTLLTPEQTISERTAKAIRACSEKGVTVALCTGRSVPELGDFLPVLTPFVRYAVCVSGALCYDLTEKKRLSAQSLDPETALRAMDLARPYAPMIHFLSDYCIMQKSSWENLSAYNMGKYKDMYSRAAHFVPDIEAFYRRDPFPLEKLNFYNTGTEARAGLEEVLQNAGLPLEMRHAEIASLELNAPGITKGTGILSLCRCLGIDPADVIAVGDAENDMDAFQAAGLGVAMGNALPEVKAGAGYVTADNAHDGCAEVIERFFGV